MALTARDDNDSDALLRFVRAATRAASRLGERLDLDWVTSVLESSLRDDFGARYARVRLVDPGGMAQSADDDAPPDARTSPLETSGTLHGVVTMAFDVEPAGAQLDVIDALLAMTASALNEVKLFAREKVARADAEMAREQLAASERRYRFVVDAIPQLVWTATANGAADFFSQRFLAHTGATLETLQGFGWLERVHPAQRERLELELAQATAAGTAFETDVELRGADGRYTFFLLHYLPLADAEKRVTRWLGTLTDIDARRRSASIERFLGQASALLGSSLDYETTLATVADLALPNIADGCMIDVVDDAGALRRVAVADADESKQSLVARMKALPPPAPDAPVYRVLELRAPMVTRWLTQESLTSNARNDEHAAILLGLAPQSGMTAPLRARGKTIGLLWLYYSRSGRSYDESMLSFVGELASRIALAVDNARLYRDAQNAVRLRDEFLSIASHELKTPLTPLKLQLARLRREMLASPEASAKLDVAERQVDRLTVLVTELLDVSRIQGDRLELEPEPLDLVRLVRDVIIEHARELAQKGSEVTLDAPKEVLGVWDRLRTDQVVSNLLSNAIKYGEGKPIAIAIESRPEEVVLSVRDHGIGIDEASQARIFGRFERAVSARHYGGFGLGLWIARKIVEASGGSISVESAPDEGSTFRVRWPKRR